MPNLGRSPTRARPGPPLQQVDRTWIWWRGRKLSYFGGCDYFRFSSHPTVLQAAHQAVDSFGLNVAASRWTTGNHQLYEQLESELAAFFGVNAAVLVSNGYQTNMAVAQALAGEFKHALIDERAHSSLLDAAGVLGCTRSTFAHRQARSAAQAARKISRSGRLILLTDGLYAHSGETAPLDQYLQLLPSNVTLWVDDAHGAGTLGRTGRGTLEHCGLRPSARIIQTITLSKAFGAYGGAILGGQRVCQQVLRRSRLLVGTTPVPLPMAAAALASLRLLKGDPTFRRRLLFHTAYVKESFRAAGFLINDGPGPIVPLRPRSARQAAGWQQKLLASQIAPPWVRYPASSTQAYLRFAISSEHGPEQLDALTQSLR